METTDHSAFMKIALEQGGLAKQDGERPFGAAVVRGGEIVAVGRCREDKLQTVLAHAETEAVDNACKTLGTNNLSDCVIYSTNEPCAMCSAVIFQAKIPQVVIGASRGDLPFLRPRNRYANSLTIAATILVLCTAYAGKKCWNFSKTSKILQVKSPVPHVMTRRTGLCLR